jgi:hypothetical protein
MKDRVALNEHMYLKHPSRLGTLFSVLVGKECGGTQTCTGSRKEIVTCKTC